MTETPRMSRYHNAVSRVGDAIPEDALPHLGDMEDHARELHALLSRLITTHAISGPDSHTLEELRSLGLIQSQSFSDEFSKSLTALHRLLHEPHRINDLAPFETTITIAVDYIMQTAPLINDLSLWRQGLMSAAELAQNFDKFQETPCTS